MGVCNVTPDSFSDGGDYLTPDAARRRVDELLAEGADVVDVGGESTRPGAPPVASGEQIDRVLPVVDYAVSQGACVSVDTGSPEVAAACLGAGAGVVNDTTCLRHEDLAAVVAAHGAALVLMHARGSQGQMRGFSEYPDEGYSDVVRDVCAEWRSAAERARARGVGGDCLLMDPGLGFAKNARQSTELLARLAEIVRDVGVPVAVGASRKSFLAVVDPGAAPRQ
jgi:dihydropteroate synthase